MNKRRPLMRSRLVLVLLVTGLAAYQYYQTERTPIDGGPDTAGNTLQAAYAAQRSGVWLEARGNIGRVLKDDNKGSRHQKFIIEVDDGRTVLVAHNIDLASRIPARVGLPIVLRGRYEWNNRGGVIHWTHRDPDGRKQGGWIEVEGVRYE